MIMCSIVTILLHSNHKNVYKLKYKTANYIRIHEHINISVIKSSLIICLKYSYNHGKYNKVNF